MNIGELVLNLGIKGTDKTVGALTNVKKGLSDTASMSLEAKAGILAAMYALEQLFASSSKAGTNLTNFNAVTGESVQTLQQYQYAARQVGISNEEAEASFKTLQSAMAKTAMGQAPPAGLAQVSLALQRAGLGGITQDDVKKFAAKPELLIQRLQQYARVEKNPALKSEILKTFGLGESMIAGLNRQAFRPEVLKQAPTYSDKEVGQLDKANIAWSNLGNKIQMAIGHFNAMHGGKLVNDISNIITQVIKLAEAFVKLADKLKLFQGIGKVFEGWTKLFGVINTEVDKIGSNKKGIVAGAKEEGKEALSGAALALKGMWSSLIEPSKPTEGSLPPPKTVPVLQKVLGSASPGLNKQSIAPTVNAPVKAPVQQNNNVKIDNHFQHPGTDHKRTADSVKQSVNHAYRQMAGQHVGA